MNFPDRATARAVCLGSHAARGDYGGYNSAIAARLSLRAQREVQLALRSNYYISAAPRQYLFIRLPH